MHDIPVLVTDRLILRKMEISDAPMLYTYWSDETVTKHMNIASFADVSEAEQMIGFLDGLRQEGKLIRWTIIRKRDGLILGSGGYNSLVSETLRGEIGYELGKEYWGQGLMAEALTAILSYGFTALQLNRVQALVETENTASQKLLVKLGFQQEGLLREYECFKDKAVDLLMYSLLRREFAACQ